MLTLERAVFKTWHLSKMSKIPELKPWIAFVFAMTQSETEHNVETKQLRC
jgi:hypothetical protein